MRTLFYFFIGVVVLHATTVYGQERNKMNSRQLSIDVQTAFNSSGVLYAPLPSSSFILDQKDDYISLLEKKYPIVHANSLPSWAINPLPYISPNQPLTYRSLYVTGGSDIIPSIGYTHNATVGWVYNPSDRWVLTASSSAFRSIQQAGHFSDVQFNTSATYRINSWMSISGYGYYDIFGMQSAQHGAIPLSGYDAGYKGLGTTFNLKVINQDSWELWLRSGVDYCFDPRSMKWEWKPTVTPELRFK